MLGKPFDWDTAQMPINVMDAHYRSFQNQVVPVCLDKKVGVIGMKGYGGSSPHGIMANSGLTASEAYRYSLSQPVSTQVVGLTSLDQLREAVALARSFAPMSAAEQTALRDRVRDMAGDGRYELFKSTVTFDGPHHRRQHGFAV
jgi:hypothetical protein